MPIELCVFKGTGFVPPFAFGALKTFYDGMVWAKLGSFLSRLVSIYDCLSGLNTAPFSALLLASKDEF